MTVVIENTINQLVRLHKYVNEDKEYRRLEMNNYCFSSTIFLLFVMMKFPKKMYLKR